MNEEIKFRPHHFLCMRFWAGNGYSEKYTARVEEILPQVKNGAKIKIVFEPDSLCAACPHLQNDICDSQSRVLKFDAEVAKLCGIKAGQTTTWQQMHKTVSEKIMEQNKFSAICGDCSWAEICHT